MGVDRGVTAVHDRLRALSSICDGPDPSWEVYDGLGTSPEVDGPGTSSVSCDSKCDSKCDRDCCSVSIALSSVYVSGTTSCVLGIVSKSFMGSIPSTVSVVMDSSSIYM